LSAHKKPIRGQAKILPAIGRQNTPEKREGGVDEVESDSIDLIQQSKNAREGKFVTFS